MSLNRETTLTGNNIIKSIVRAKELGYIIRLRYVGVSSPEIAKERIAKRVLMGGYGISEDTVDVVLTILSKIFIKSINCAII